jgi:TonB-dependent receptor
VKKIATTLFKLTLSIILTASFSLTYAQSAGKLTGKITDAKTGEALIGASVLVQGLSKGAATNVSGEYNITALPAGTYEILVRYVGYQNKLISDVQVKGNEATSLNITLTEANTQQLQAVTVKATFRQESNNSLYVLQKNSSRVSDGISAEAIRRSPDRNIGEVLKRVSGATVTDGRFIVVRGLGDRYNTTMLNNAVLPSTEPDKKAFSFDIVPSSLVDNIVINKTATPDLPGDFAGGAVQVSTKDFPDTKIITLQVGIAGNTKTTFKDFKQGSMQKLDFLGGFDNGSRKLPLSWVNLNKTDYVTAPLAQQIAVTQRFSNSFGVKHQFKGYPGQNLQLTVGNTKQLNEDSKLGYVASLTYGNNIERFDRERTEVSFSNGEPTFNFNDNLYRFTNSLGGILNVSYSHKNSKYSLKNTYNNTFVNSFTDRNGAYVEGGESNRINLRSTQTDVSRSGVLSSVFEGQHFLTKSKINIDYNVSYGKSYRYQPDQRILEQFQTPSTGPNWYVRLSNITSPAIQNAGRLYTDLDENIYGGKVNVAIPYQLFKQSNKLKVGYLTSYRDRTFSAEALGYASGVSNADQIDLVNGVTADNIFSKSFIAQRGIVISRINGYSFSYDGTVKLDAGYIMTENKFSDKLRMILGARVERYKQTIQQPGISTSKQNYLNTDVLPSVNFTYALTPKSNLRLAASQTVARPELRELANFLYYDFVTDYSVRGNVDLKRTLISNFDLRYELFPSAGQIISVSAFYKKFNNAIEQTNGGNRDFSFQNANSAYDYGAELEFRRRLDLLGSQAYLKNLTFYANAAYIRSRVTVANGNPNRPLQGQSPYILNGGLQYAGSNNGLVLNLLYNRIGQRLTYVGVSGGRDIYENPRDLVDFQIGKRLMKNKAEIKLNVSDIFAQSIRLYTNFDSKTSYNPNNGDKSFQSTIPGRNVNLQFIYNF